MGVTLGDGVVVPADITVNCLNPLPTPTKIVCDLSGEGLFPAAGDYRLTVITNRPHSNPRQDHYDLTIGAVGPQGEPGVVSIYTVFGETRAVPPDIDPWASTAECDPGDIVVGGGYEAFDSQFEPSFSILRSEPVGGPPQGYGVVGFCNLSTCTRTVNLTASARCLDLPPLRVVD